MESEIENKDSEFSRQVNLYLAKYEVWCQENPDSSFAAFAENCHIAPAVAAEIAEVLEVGGFVDGLMDSDRRHFPSTSTMAPEGESDLVGQSVGNYQIVRCLGTGGMGKVWLAEQRRPVHRSVAIKFINSNEPLPLLEKRLKDEQQALASMSHPNIAGVLDAGTYRDRPYFVMDFVPGTSLTEYCDTRRLSVRARLELFLQLCAAIQHVHQRSLLHRDIKPSNVLVTEIDGQAHVKVIDFGLVQSLEEELGGASARPSLGIGSPLWMSPEQVGSEHPAQADTRSDIFSLGTILYQLLTQSTPITKEFFQSASLGELVREIQEHVPDRPSVRIDRHPELPWMIKQHCRTPLPVIIRQLKEDLDYVVMQALAKDRESRYGTVMALADDVQRFLKQEPVAARPSDFTYRLRKFATKNRTAVAIASFVGVLQLVTTVVAIGLAIWAWDQQRGAKQAQEVAEAAEKSAQEAEHSAEKLLEIITSNINALNPSIPGVEHASWNPVFLEGYRNDLRAKVAGDQVTKREQLICAKMYSLLGNAVADSGRTDIAIDDLRNAIEIYENLLGATATKTLESKISLASVLLEHGDLESVHAITAEVLAADSERKSKEYLQAQVLMNRAKIRQGKMTHVIADLESVRKMTEERFVETNSVSIEAKSALAEAWFEKRCYGVSAALYEKCFRTAQQVWGQDSRQAMELEVSYWAARVSNEMNLVPIDLVKQWLTRANQKFGADNIYTLKINALYIRTLFYCDSENPVVRKLQSDLMEACQRLYGENSLEVAHQKLSMAKYLEPINPEDAAEFASQASEIFARIKGKKSWDFLRARCRFIRVYLARGECFSPASRKAVLDTIDKYASLAVHELGKDTLVTTDLLEFKAMWCGEQGRMDECFALLNDNLEFSRRGEKNTLLTGETLSRLGDAYFRSNRLEDAAFHYEKSFHVRKEWQGLVNRDVYNTLSNAQRCYRKLGETVKADSFNIYWNKYELLMSRRYFESFIRANGGCLPTQFFAL